MLGLFHYFGRLHFSSAYFAPFWHFWALLKNVTISPYPKHLFERSRFNGWLEQGLGETVPYPHTYPLPQPADFCGLYFEQWWRLLKSVLQHEREWREKEGGTSAGMSVSRQVWALDPIPSGIHILSSMDQHSSNTMHLHEINPPPPPPRTNEGSRCRQAVSHHCILTHSYTCGMVMAGILETRLVHPANCWVHLHTSLKWQHPQILSLSRSQSRILSVHPTLLAEHGTYWTTGSGTFGTSSRANPVLPIK